jgi:hypothetical protein
MSVNEAWALLSAVAIVGLALVWFAGKPSKPNGELLS